MRRILFVILLLFISWTSFAHEDIYKTIGKSNVRITVKFGYEWSWEHRIIESYAELINDFIREIDSTEKAYIQFEEDYCFFNDSLFFVAYDGFKKYMPPYFPDYYDMQFINTQKGINVIVSEKYFKLKTLLQLLEFGFQNKNSVIGKEKRLYNDPYRSLLFEPKTASIVDSILQSEPSHLVKKYLSRKVDFHDIPKDLTQKGIKLYLQNDSIFFVDSEDTEILKLLTVYTTHYDESTDCLFLFNTNHNFYFINKSSKSNKIQYDWPLPWDCLNQGINIDIEYVDKERKYKIYTSWTYRLRRHEILSRNRYFTMNIRGNEWVYFDEINGITK